MRLRFGFVTGLFLGYYLGAKAGRERYEQLNRLGRKLRKSGAMDSATDKARSAVDAGYSRAKQEVRHRLHHNGNNSETFSPS